MEALSISRAAESAHFAAPASAGACGREAAGIITAQTTIMEEKVSRVIGVLVGVKNVQLLSGKGDRSAHVKRSIEETSDGNALRILGTVPVLVDIDSIEEVVDRGEHHEERLRRQSREPAEREVDALQRRQPLRIRCGVLWHPDVTRLVERRTDDGSVRLASRVTHCTTYAPADAE